MAKVEPERNENFRFVPPNWPLDGIFFAVWNIKWNRARKGTLPTIQREAEEKARLAWETAIPLGGNP